MELKKQKIVYFLELNNKIKIYFFRYFNATSEIIYSMYEDLSILPVVIKSCNAFRHSKCSNPVARFQRDADNRASSANRNIYRSIDWQPQWLGMVFR